MQEKLLKEYVELRAEVKALEEKEDEIRSKIVSNFEKQGVEKMEVPDLGTFTVAHKVTYAFSTKVAKLETALKIEKEREVKKGTAKVKSDTSYLRYTEPKLDLE